MPLGSNLAGLARVSYEAVGLAEFKNDNAQAEASYRDSTRGMSDEAIKLELSQDRLRRSLQKGPAAYREQARAELQVRNAERALRGETDALTRSQDRNRRGIGGLRGSIVGLAAAYVGTQGVINLIRGSVNAAREEELVLGQTRVALEAVGLSYDQYGAKLDATIAKVQQLGFDDEELAKSFQTLVRSADSPAQALEQLGDVADVARGRYIDLEAATQIVNKANLGMSGGLRRIGLDVDKNATSTELLIALHKAYGQSAEEAADSGVAAADRFSVAVEETQESIGAGLAPAVTDLSERITKWLNRADNQERLQREINDAVETGEKVVRGLAAGLELVGRVAGPAVDALGGIENVAKTATVLWAAWKVKTIAGFGATAISSSLTSRKMIAGATLAGRAWDIATRPRTLVVTTTTTGVPGAPGSPGTPSTPGRPGRPSLARGLGPAALAVGLGLTLFGSTGGDRRGPLTRSAMETIKRGGRVDSEVRAALGELAEHPSRILDYSQAELDAVETRLRTIAVNRRPRAGDPRVGDRPSERPGVRLTPRDQVGAGTDSGGAARSRRTMADILLELAREETRPGTAPELRLHREARNLIQRQIDNLERRKNLTAKQKDELRRLYGELASEQSAIDSIIDDGEAKLAAQRETAETKREERRQREAARMEKILNSASRASERRGDLLAGTGGSRENMRRQALAGVNATVKGLRDDGSERVVTQADVRRELLELIKNLNSLREFGSNFAPDGEGPLGRIATHVAAQTDIQMEQSRQQGMLIRGQWHPGAWYAGNELAVAGTGVGF